MQDFILIPARMRVVDALGTCVNTIIIDKFIAVYFS
jgi:hypothetical protein